MAVETQVLPSEVPKNRKDSDDGNAARIQSLAQRYTTVRDATVALCATLQPEDFVIQSMEDTSPTKWHLAHVTWFFERFVLREADSDYKQFDPVFDYLFNSYYVQAGERWHRPQRGLLSRPTVGEVLKFRDHVDRGMIQWFEKLEKSHGRQSSGLLDRVEIGLNHEQQHQELLLTDIKHGLSVNPLRPVFRELRGGTRSRSINAAEPAQWIPFAEGIREIGFAGPGFSYDNESPRHRQLIPQFELSSRTVTCGEYLEFMADGGYKRPELWLSLGWAAVEANGWKSPLYWEDFDDDGVRGQGPWRMFTLGGMRDVNLSEPVTHISYFEADAYARWKGCDLPTEAMWEIACQESGNVPDSGNFVEDDKLHLVPVSDSDTSGTKLHQMLGNTWEWTSSPYIAYPGFRPAPGALGEYNGKFMCNQMVLRGGSCATPRSHIRPTYRNFFPPDARWQFSGIRLARYTAS